MEYFVAWYSGNTFEQTTFYRRAFGPMWWAGWTMIICNAFVSQLLWFRKIRTNLTALFVISIFINIGMWFERYVIIVSSLSNDYIPWAWGQMNPTWADWGILAGSFGWFGMWFLLFAKNFPIVAIQEIKEMIPMPRKRGRAPLMALLKRAKRRVPGRAGLVHPHRRGGGRHPRAARHGHRDLVVYTPAPNHEIEEALEHRVSPVRLFTLIGGLTGCAAGFAMTIWMSLRLAGARRREADRVDPALRRHRLRADHPAGRAQHGGGRGVVLGAHGKRGIAYDPRFSDDQIGIFVPPRRTSSAAVEQLLRSAGAVEVRHEAA